jgi:peptidoglycan/xylan/chitin deacetylase (PgdA/CDA1 family)
MPSQLTIVKYSYVRDVARSRFPRLKARGLVEFEAQLDYIASTYHVVSAEDVVAAAAGEAELPPQSCWLVFENGYSDHYRHVVPRLSERGWKGSFYVPAKVVVERQILDVNKVHFLLASTDDVGGVVSQIEDFCQQQHASGVDLHPFEWYWRRYAHANRWDPPEVIFVKRMLQKGLPEAMRSACADLLFTKYVTDEPEAFAAELYLDAEQLRLMLHLGMHLGSHGYGHYWLDSLDPEEQAADIDASLECLAGIGVDTRRWTMCYPQGAYNDDTLDLLRHRGCAAAFTNATGPATLPGSPYLELPTLDTNDLPTF